ncbi:MAG: 3'-5' exonuclease [Eubacteriales bacterium]|nr:3'-5' exonuclease [Eubacteriales bacterium]
MNYIVLDLEWNQGNAEAEPQNPQMPFEIIEIGAVRLNENREHDGDFSSLIRPSCYHTMHYITGKLVHLDMETLEKERGFQEVMDEFQDWCGDDPLFCTWGPNDLTELQRNLLYHKEAPLSDGPLPFLDVQKLFGIAYETRKSRRSLEYAIDFLKIEKDSPFHRAHSDAYYTAKILAGLPQEVLRNISYDSFSIPKNRKGEVHARFDDYTKYISRGFETRGKALGDAEVMDTHCYLCGRRLRKKIKWFTPNGKHYYSVSHCPEHGDMKAKIRLRKSQDEKIYVVKTEKFIQADELTALRQRAKKAAKRPPGAS